MGGILNASCYLIDFEGNLWSFGNNTNGQLGHGNRDYTMVPKIINTLKDIQKISYGFCGLHFLVINSQYSTIWGNEFHSRAKSARK